MSAELSYVLPIKSSDAEGLDELTGYLEWLARRAEVIVVDGSEPRIFELHAARWTPPVRHLKPRAGLAFLNGKVDGVTTGLEEASAEKVVIADDDVRYEGSALARISRLLDDYDLVRPQNHFATFPWHALWDSGRALLNRSFRADYPGTLGVRRSSFLSAGGYDGNVMFENLELIRTLEVAGGSSIAPLDLYVARRPPPTRLFLQQRIRQAYDDLTQPTRLILSMLTLPGLAWLTRRPRWLLAAVLGIIAVAEKGRRRAGGHEVFPATASLMAPLWVLERGTCIWPALVHRSLGGIPYRGNRIRRAANPKRVIRSRLASRTTR